MALLAPDPTLSREVDIPQLDVFLDIGFRFNPSPEDVITFYLPNLIAGQNPPDAVGLFHNAAVYGAQEPKDLAAQFAPVSRSSNEERYFFTTCHRIKGRVSRVAGGGTWVLQSAKNVTKKGRKIGEVKSFRFQLRKGKTNTNWLMEEYHLACYPETGDFVEPVVCRIYVSPRVGTNSAAHQESAAALMPLPPQPQPPIAPPRQVPVMIRQQLQLPAPVKRLHIVTPVITESPPCAKRMRGAILPTVASVPPPRPSQRFMAIAPPRPACAPQLPPQQPASLLTGEHHHTAPQPSVTATLDQGLVPAEDCNEPDKNDGVGMEELMRIIEEDLNVYMKSYRPVEEEDGKNGKPKEVLVLVPDNDEHDKLAKLLEDVLKEAMEEKSINDGKNELQKADEHDVPNNDEGDENEFLKELLEDGVEVDDQFNALEIADRADEIALPDAPPVVQTIAPNDDELKEFRDEDLNDLNKLMDEKVEKVINDDDEPHRAIDVGNDLQGDDGRGCEANMLPPPAKEKEGNEQEDWLDVFKNIDVDQMGEEILNMPLKDCNNYLYY